MGGAEGDLQGAIIGRAFVEYRHPLGVGGGLAGAMAAPSAIAPALGHQDFRGL